MYSFVVNFNYIAKAKIIETDTKQLLPNWQHLMDSRIHFLRMKHKLYQATYLDNLGRLSREIKHSVSLLFNCRYLSLLKKASSPSNQ